MLETDPIDLLLDTEHDIVFTDGDLEFSRGLPGVQQNLKISWLMICGEYFANLAEGVKWFENDTVTAEQAIIGSKFDRIKAIGEFRDAALADGLITEIVDLTVEFDEDTRTMAVNGIVRCEFGEFTAQVSRGAR